MVMRKTGVWRFIWLRKVCNRSYQGGINFGVMIERTLIIIKPDGIQRHLAGELISRFENKGFKLLGLQFVWISEEQACRHYSEHEGKDFYEGVVKYLSSGPSLLMVLEAERAIEMARKMVGATFGFEAESGTIRGDYSCSGRYNLVHASDSGESAEKEIGLFFEGGELVDYELSDKGWVWGSTE